MITEDDFLRIVRDELSLPLDVTDLDTDLDGVASWNSMYMLRLVNALEQETGVRIPVGRLLIDRSLRALYDRVTAG